MRNHPPIIEDYRIERVIKMYDRSKKTKAEINSFEVNPLNALHSSHENAFRTFNNVVLCNLELDEKLKYLVEMNQTGVNYFRMILNDGKPMQFTVEGNAYQTVGKYSSDWFYFDPWLAQLMTAVALRDNAAIKLLCKIPVADFQKAKPEFTDTFDIALMPMIQGLFSTEANHVELIQNMMAHTGPENYTAMRAPYATQVLMPMANLMVMALSNVDEAHYHHTWRKALESHVSYWTMDQDLKNSYNGWVAFPIIAASVMMYDKKGYKLPADLTDDEKLYVPEWLVYGDFEPQPSVGVDFFEGEV